MKIGDWNEGEIYAEDAIGHILRMAPDKEKGFRMATLLQAARELSGGPWRKVVMEIYALMGDECEFVMELPTTEEIYT